MQIYCMLAGIPGGVKDGVSVRRCARAVGRTRREIQRISGIGTPSPVGEARCVSRERPSEGPAHLSSSVRILEGLVVADSANPHETPKSFANNETE